MKKVAVMILICLAVFSSIIGCAATKAAQEPQKQTTAIGNPWSDWDCLQDAEAAVGFSLGLPEMIGGSYTAEAFRTMKGALLEVIYRDGEYEVRVRKQKGEGQDISGDYTQYDTGTEEPIEDGTMTTWRDSASGAVKQIISCQGYSWSLTAPNGYWGDSNADFVNQIIKSRHALSVHGGFDLSQASHFL